MISKPKEILELEKIYGITLKEIAESKHLFWSGGNCYKLNNKGEVIELNLSYNQIGEIRGLEELKNLQKLYLAFNQITEIKGLEKLIQLQELDLHYNPIAEIKGLEELTQLQKLNLTFNRIAEIIGLEKLTQLQELDLSENQIEEIKGLEELKNLQKLNLYRNQIAEIKGLEELTQLQELSLYNNQIEEIKGLEELKNLQKLDLHGNQIVEIKGLDELEQLQTLLLSNNKLEEKKISKLENIIKREKFELRINDNPFWEKNIWLADKFDNTHRDVMLKYFSDLKQNKISIKLPVKVMLLGNHGTGKSTFLDYLQTGELPTNKESTHILKIVPSCHREDVGSGIELPKALFYDFGGQDYYHGLYRAFFSDESINLLLWRNKTNENQIRKAEDKTNNYTRDYMVAYWLYQLSEPILLIQTHADKEQRTRINDIPIVPDREHYVSLNKEKTEKNIVFTSGLKYLSDNVNELIDEKRNIPVEKNYYYSSFLRFILDYSDEKYIRVKEDILDKENYGRTILENETERDLLIYLKEELLELSKTGLVLYYKNNNKLNNIVWLNPTKTITYIHNQILTKELMKEYKGIISENDFNGLCKNETERESFEKIKELLIEQKVIFYDRHEKQYIIPGYLQLSDEDKLHENLICEFDEQPDFTVKFKYYIPFGLINQFICLYGKSEGIQLKNCWRDELIFVFDNHYRIRIAFDFSQLTIAVYINEFSKRSSLLDLNEIKRWIFFNIVDLYNNGKVRHSSVFYRNDDGKWEWFMGGVFPRDKFILQIKEDIKSKNREDIKISENIYLSTDKNHFVQLTNLENIEKGHNEITAYDEYFNTFGTQYVVDYKCFTNNTNITSMKENDSKTENNNNQKPQIIVHGDYVEGDKIMGSKTIIKGDNNIVQSYNSNEQKLVNELQNQGITKEQANELIAILREEEPNTENRTLGTRARNWCENIKTIGLNVLSNLIFTIMYGLPPA